jgi:hypothetical protein
MAELESRIQQLEDIEAIRTLKAHYLNACDLKQIDEIRDCFMPGPVHIDYGMIGTFDHREGLVQVFNEQGNHPHIKDSHHGSNPEIEIINATTAKARWALYFHQINTAQQMITQLTGFYEDEYTKTDSGWKIRSTIFSVKSTLASKLEGSQASILFAGGAMG